MGQGVTQHKVHKYYYINKAVSEKDCDNFLEEHKNAEFKNATVAGGDEVNEKQYRQAKVRWINGNELIVRAIWSYVLEMNRNFKLHLDDYEQVQLTKYNQDNYYKWHQDSGNLAGPLARRKLSAVLQLSKPEDYEGCELQIFNGDLDLEKLPIENQGSLIIFSSTEWHRVTPLTSGIRYSLVFWATGSPLV